MNEICKKLNRFYLIFKVSEMILVSSGFSSDSFSIFIGFFYDSNKLKWMINNRNVGNQHTWETCPRRRSSNCSFFWLSSSFNSCHLCTNSSSLIGGTVGSSGSLIWYDGASVESCFTSWRCSERSDLNCYNKIIQGTHENYEIY